MLRSASSDACAGAASAQEQPLRFIHVLQRTGYGDMAVEYLNLLAKRPDLPPEVRDVWDLEMSKSLKAAAADAFDAKEYERLIEESQKHLAKFLKEKPNNPAAANALAAWGDFLMKRAHGTDSLRRKTVEGKDKAQYEKCLADARAGLAEAREKFEQAEAKFKTRLDELPPPSKLPSKKAERAEAVGGPSRGRGRSARRPVPARRGSNTAWARPTPIRRARNAPPRFEKAGKAFDDVFQRNRTRPRRV